MNVNKSLEVIDSIYAKKSELSPLTNPNHFRVYLRELREVIEALGDAPKAGYSGYANSGYSTETPKFSSNAEKRRYEMQKTPKFTGNPGKSEPCEHVYESDCHGIEMIKSPSGKEWAIGGTNTKDRWLFDPWCGKKLINKQPSEKKESEVEELAIELWSVMDPLGITKWNTLSKDNQDFYKARASHLINAGWSKKEGKDG